MKTWSHWTAHDTSNSIFVINFIPMYFQKKCLLYIIFIRCKLYAAAVIKLRFIVAMLIIILCICISLFSWEVYVLILFIFFLFISYLIDLIVYTEPQFPFRIRWCYGFANGSFVNTISTILVTRSMAFI